MDTAAALVFFNIPMSLQTYIDSVHRTLKPHQIFAVTFYLSTIVISLLYSLLGVAPETYFSKKRNIFNILFVKLGWFWTTLVFFAYLYNVLGRKQPAERGVARYAAVTFYWYLLTQWLWGPSLIDRVFVATGGRCVDLTNSAALQHIYQQTVCRKMGGTWNGGHDVSGHCVLLLHASLFLWEESAWVYYSIPSLKRIKQAGGWPWKSVLAVFAILTFWWYMLVVTCVYFHGHFELLTGTIFGFAGWALLVSEMRNGFSLLLGRLSNMFAIKVPRCISTTWADRFATIATINIHTIEICIT